jgi:hypothetical protein
LLLALAPPPLDGQSTMNNLWATDAAPASGSELASAVFQTRVPAKEGAWKYIYIHDSGPAKSAALGNSDHFIIANGTTRPDGQIIMTQRWNAQTAAAAPAGVQSIDSSCISICVAGDFNASRPTPSQVRRLTELVSTLQGQLGIGGDKVYCLADAAPGAGIGRQFPLESLRQQILP